MIYLDTHVAVYLAAGTPKKFSAEAARLIDKEEALISPLVVLELQYLYEIGRLGWGPQKLLAILEYDFRVKVCELPFEQVVKWALDERWTRDVFDRMIVAQARARGEAPLLTADERIRANYAKAVW